MGIHSIKQVQKIPVKLEAAWTFFSDPANLTQITPASMQFRIISAHQGMSMYPGQIIEYTVKPLLNISWYWMTEITHVEDRRYFVDEQRFGPYAMWHHQHHFVELDGGVEMTDIVHYKLPYGFVGKLVNKLMVRKQLDDIFKFRSAAVARIFGVWKG